MQLRAATFAIPSFNSPDICHAMLRPCWPIPAMVLQLVSNRDHAFKACFVLF